MDTADFSHYLKRNETLIGIGYASYSLYLQSDLWIGIRNKVLKAKGRDCFLCDAANATVIHHCRYDRADLIGEDLSQMFPLCSICHHKIEFDVSGRKLTVPEMLSAFSIMVSKRVPRRSVINEPKAEPMRTLTEDDIKAGKIHSGGYTRVQREILGGLCIGKMGKKHKNKNWKMSCVGKRIPESKYQQFLGIARVLNKPNSIKSV